MNGTELMPRPSSLVERRHVRRHGFLGAALGVASLLTTLAINRYEQQTVADIPRGIVLDNNYHGHARNPAPDNEYTESMESRESDTQGRIYLVELVDHVDRPRGGPPGFVLYARTHAAGPPFPSIGEVYAGAQLTETAADALSFVE